jgi:hypothetical protein
VGWLRRHRPIEWLALAAALLLWLCGVIGPLYQSSTGDDLSSLATAAELLRSGMPEHLYDRRERFTDVSREFQQAADAIGVRGYTHPYVQAPLIAIAMRPLKVRFESLRRIWFVLSVLAFLAALFLSIRIYVPELQGPFTWTLVFLVLCFFEPLRYALNLGQTTPFVLLALVATIALQRSGRPISAGLVLAIPVFIKVSPVLIALLWAWRGPRRAVLALLAGLVALTLLSLLTGGLALHGAYLERLHELNQQTIVAFNNHSLIAFLTRFQVQPAEIYSWRLHPSGVLHPVAIGCCAALAVGSWLGLRRIPVEQEERWRPPAEAVLILVCLLASPLSWTHYLMLLTPVLAATYAAARPADRLVTIVAIAVALVICCQPVLVDQVQPARRGPLLIGLPTLAMIFLVAVNAWLARKAT